MADPTENDLLVEFEQQHIMAPRQLVTWNSK
jgi:hypothetical protein